MQTFLPYPDFQQSAKCLDYRRLGKQRVEAKQILDILTLNKDSGWKNHPAVKMWRGYENALANYMNEFIQEWIRRGYKNTMKIYKHGETILPKWIGDSRLHDSHRSNLLRKDQEFYSKYEWEISNDMPYWWPI